jgi:predicted type IV restriction endonuclease
MNRNILGVITIYNNYAICGNFPNYLIYDNGDVFSIKNKKFLTKNKTLNNEKVVQYFFNK